MRRAGSGNSTCTCIPHSMLRWPIICRSSMTLSIAVLRALHRFAPGRQRMRAAGQDRKPMLGGGRGRIEPQLAQFDPRVVGAAMRLGRHLDLRLQELPADMSRRRRNRRLGTAQSGVSAGTSPVSASDRKYSSSMPNLEMIAGRKFARLMSRQAPASGCEAVARCGSNRNSMMWIRFRLAAMDFDVCFLRCPASATSTPTTRLAKASNGPSASARPPGRRASARYKAG